MAVTTVGELRFILDAEVSGLKRAQEEVDKYAEKLRKSIGANRDFTNVNKSVQSSFVKQVSAIQRARETVLTLRSQMERLNKAGADTTELNRRLSSAFSTLNRAMSNGIRTQKDFNRSVDAFNRQANVVKRSVTTISNRNGKAANETAELSKRMTDLSKSVQVALGPLSGIASRITAITSLANRNTAAIAGVVGAMIAFGGAAVQSVRAGLRFESEMKVLENRAKALQDTLGFTTNELNEMARALGRETLTNANEARKAIVTLTTATSLSGENFRRALTLSQDLAASGFGNLISQARRLAAVLQDPEEGMERLRRVGVTFNDQQQAILRTLVETGDVATAQTIILDELAKKVGGNAKSAAEGLAGAWDTLLETLRQTAEVAVSEQGVLTGIAAQVNRVTEAIINLDKQSNIVRKFGEAVLFAGESTVAGLANLIENLEVVILTIGGLVSGRVLSGVISALTKLARTADKLKKSLVALVAVKAFKAIFSTNIITLAGTFLGLVAGIALKLDLLPGLLKAIKGTSEQVWINLTESIGDATDALKTFGEKSIEVIERNKIAKAVLDSLRNQVSGVRTTLGSIINAVIERLGPDIKEASENAAKTIKGTLEGAKEEIVNSDFAGALRQLIGDSKAAIEEAIGGDVNTENLVNAILGDTSKTLEQLEADINSIKFPEAIEEINLKLESLILQQQGVSNKTIELASTAGILDKAFRVTNEGVVILNDSLREFEKRQDDIDQLKEIFKLLEKDLPPKAALEQATEQLDNMRERVKELAEEFPQFGALAEKVLAAISNKQKKLNEEFEKPLKDANDLIDKLNQQAEALGKSERELFIINQLLKLDKQGLEEMGLAAEELERVFERTRRAAGKQFDQREATKQFKASMQEIASLIDRSFDRIGSEITDMFVRGEEAAIDFGNVVRSVMSELIQFFVQLALVNPIKNLFLSNVSGAKLAPTLSSIGAGALGAGAASAGGAGGVSGLGLAGLGAGLVNGIRSPGLGILASKAGGALGLGGSAQAFLGNAFTNVGFAGIGTLGAQLLGLSEGGLASTALGTAGGLVGGGIGTSITALGSLGGPIGAVAGGVLGSVLGGLFGSEPSREIAGVGFRLGEGITGTGGKGASPDAAAEIARELGKVLEGFATSAGGEARGRFSVQTFGNADEFDNGKLPFSLNFGFQFETAQELLREAPLELLKAGKVAIKGLGEEISNVLSISIKRNDDLNKVLDDLNFAREVLNLASTENLTALNELIRQFDVMRERALALGLSIQSINEAELRALSDLESQIISAMGGIVEEAKRLLNIDQLFKLREDLSFGSLSPLAPVPKFQAARDQFNKVAQAALSGDIEAIKQFPGIARDAVGIGRDVFASGPEFASFFNVVQGTLDQVIGSQQELAEGIDFELGNAVRETSEQQIAALREMQKTLSDDLKAVRREIAKRR